MAATSPSRSSCGSFPDRDAKFSLAFRDLPKEAGVEVEVYRVPGNYPPTPSRARTLSGMGTVDLRGEYGTYSWYSSKPPPAKKNLKADYQMVTVEDTDFDSVPDTVHASLKGPPDVLHLEPGALPGPHDFLMTGLTVRVDPEEDVAWLQIGGEDVILHSGQVHDPCADYGGALVG